MPCFLSLCKAAKPASAVGGPAERSAGQFYGLLHGSCIMEKNTELSVPLGLIVTDFDGTIHTEATVPPISKQFQEIIADLQSQGVKWMINTGRDLPGLLEELARARCQVKPDFLGLVEREIYVLKANQYVSVADWNKRCARDQSAAFAKLKPFIPSMFAWVEERFQATVYSDSWSPFCVIAESNHDADQIMDYLQQYCQMFPELSLVRNDVYARFSHAAYHKGSVMAEVTKRLGLAPNQVLAAGDHWNDLPMLSRNHAHWLVAPANAVASVKECVEQQGGYVAKAFWSDGVAEGIIAALETSVDSD